MMALLRVPMVPAGGLVKSCPAEVCKGCRDAAAVRPMADAGTMYGPLPVIRNPMMLFNCPLARQNSLRWCRNTLAKKGPKPMSRSRTGLPEIQRKIAAGGPAGERRFIRGLAEPVSAADGQIVGVVGLELMGEVAGARASAEPCC